MEKMRRIEIWFFVGSLLLVYGLLILGGGVYHLMHPPTQQVVLMELHADIWWGALLFILGSVYCFKYWPFRT